MNKLNKTELGNLLNQLKNYQNYSIGFNGSLEDRPTEELIERIENNLDNEEVRQLNEFIRGSEIGKIMELLAYSTADFYFSID